MVNTGEKNETKTMHRVLLTADSLVANNKRKSLTSLNNDSKFKNHDTNNHPFMPNSH